MESPPKMRFFLIFLVLCSFPGYSSQETSTTLTIDTCVKDLSDLLNEIGERYSPPLPRAAGKNTQKTGFLRKKAYKSKSNKNFANFFGYF
jgi:hypothetical protein